MGVRNTSRPKDTLEGGRVARSSRRGRHPTPAVEDSHPGAGGGPEAKLTDASEGQFFERHRMTTETTAELLAQYEKLGAQENRAWSTESGRAAHLRRHLGQLRASALSVRHVEEYRVRRSAEKTQRGGPPSPATLDREVELLKRVLNHAVRLVTLRHNPIAEARLLRKPNVRRMVVDEEMFGRLFDSSEEPLRPILLVAFDTGMRKREILDLALGAGGPQGGRDPLSPQDTKAEELASSS